MAEIVKFMFNIKKERLMIMDKIMDILPFLVPIFILEMGLLVYTIRHILTHEHYKMGNRKIWLLVTIIGMNLVGPILYFVLGREDA